MVPCRQFVVRTHPSICHTRPALAYKRYNGSDSRRPWLGHSHAESGQSFWVMSQAAKAQEPSMEEILASIRRIIAEDDSKPAKPEAKPEPPAAKAPPPPPPKPAPPPPAPAAAANKQDDIDAMLAGLDEPAEPEPPPPAPPPPPEPEPEPEPDVLELTEAMQAPAPTF